MNNQKSKPSIEDYATIEAISEGAPVYSFNNLIYIYGQSPDFYPDAAYQSGNTNSVSKIKLKKTWEIKNNYMGFCHEMTPRTKYNDSQPFLPVHLIDGDPDTIWASFECFAPDAREEWIRIDLPVESLVSQIKIICKKRFMNKDKSGHYRPYWDFGNALPGETAFKISRDAWHWEEIYKHDDISGDPDEITAVLDKPAFAKQILITGKNFSKNGYEGYMFSISGVEVLSPEGRNLALVSNGAGVTVSSTSDAHNSDRHSANSLWGPLQYDIGNKWTKVGSDNGSSMWCFTEHEKGVLKIDEDLDAAITEAVNNGINVMMTLDFKGNWVYESRYKKPDWTQARFKELCDSYLGGVPTVDENPEMFEGYLKWVEYMVVHFKDRVKYFEISNEWNCWNQQQEPSPLEWYKNIIFKPTLDLIKRIAPDVKIALGAPAGFDTEAILSCLKDGIAEKIDGVGWHAADFPNNEYFDKVRAFRTECEKLGFKGEYFVNEIYAGAAYPPGPVEGNIFRMTDMEEAKYYIKTMVGYACLNIESGPCHVHFTGFPHPQSVCRTTVPSQYIAPSQPKPSYYAIRNASTIMDDFYEADFPAEFLNENNNPEIVKFTLESGDKSKFMVAAFLSVPVSDKVTEHKTTLTVRVANLQSASVIDVFNGTVHELNIKTNGGTVVIDDIFIKDYPLFFVLN
ncbi:MAG: discoidin domain-containing protein [Oscillospiraceae bacterium]|nr:discoidin domain-containing protein [Oscillospiraceae bacterium]